MPEFLGAHYFESSAFADYNPIEDEEGPFPELHSYIEFDEEATASPVYSFAPGASHVERTFIVPWEQRVKFVQSLLGYPKIVTVPDRLAPFDTYISRYIPHACLDFTRPNKKEDEFISVLNPVDDEGLWLFAKQVTRMVGLEPRGRNSPTDFMPEYGYAMLTVVYEPSSFKHINDFGVAQHNGTTGISSLPYEFTHKRYITRTQRPSVEYLSLPRGRYRYVDKVEAGKTPADFAHALLFPLLELTYTWHEVPFLPEAAIGLGPAAEQATNINVHSPYLGCINGAVFTDAIRSYNPGTLLLTAVELKPYRMASGAFVHDIQYKMLYREPYPFVGHNYFLRYRPADQALRFYKITNDGNQDILGDLRPLGDGPGNATGPKPPGTSTPVYPYRAFTDLFSFHKRANPDDFRL